MNNIIDILKSLVSIPSITPFDANCQQEMMRFFTNLGFECIPLNKEPVSNFFAYYGTQGPLLVFAGHTDVVPVGDESLWRTNPFVLTEQDGMLYGRGTADMKGSLACMMHMAKRFITAYPSFPGRLGFLITSGEEGDHYDVGTPYVMQQLAQQGIHLDYCIVGEPSSTKQTGDVIKIGRRGSLSAKVTLQGIQGHVAYPHLADNPIHKISAVLAKLTHIEWDKGNDYFPPTTLQVTHLRSGGHASNIIPSELLLEFNIRYSTEQTESQLKARIESLFAQSNLSPCIEWRLSGQPFLTQTGKLLDATRHAILKHTDIKAQCSTSGGTSDGRFIAPYGVEVIELGPVNASIHQVNECVAIKDLEDLEAIYFSICETLLL